MKIKETARQFQPIVFIKAINCLQNTHCRLSTVGDHTEGDFLFILHEFRLSCGVLATRTEKLIEQGMDKLMEGKTVFVIAHKLSTVRNSQAIMVLEKGEIIERGNHEQLITQKGKYYQLYTGAFELD